MLKLTVSGNNQTKSVQPPSGGCVLKHLTTPRIAKNATQPPSGGCVLKRVRLSYIGHAEDASRLQAAVC